ncbi:MAG: aminotransferase class I/II-fold pyridoxal phosphate-dependent enzyme [Paramuribaculum sp.]|nr:aminotransferase class I/II-fold pyridoxal phosphate-dependent enzyme [Paramuribaculum sp.]
MIYDYIDGVLDRLTAEGNFRTLPEGIEPGMADFTTNDYLGIAQRQDFAEEFMSTAFINFRESFTNHLTPFTSSASRLLCGHPSEHILLEQRLSELYGGRAALLFNSGYHANTGLIAALGSLRSTLIVADKLVHASIIDGMKLADAPSRRFAHNNFDHLARILEKESKEFENLIRLQYGWRPHRPRCPRSPQAPLSRNVALRRRSTRRRCVRTRRSRPLLQPSGF